MKTRILQLILTAMFCVTSVGAQSLLMRHRDGTVTDIPLLAAPILETADGNIAVTTTDGSLTYDNNEVLAIMFQTPRSDVNRDYHTDISDVVSVINAMAGDNTYKDVSDVNGDSKTDISDVVAVINSIAGKKNDLPLPSFAPDQTSAIGDAFYIYRNDGEFNAFLRYEVENITFDNGNSLIQTADSTYAIPLAAIDSVSFIQPETKFKPEVIVMNSRWIPYIVKTEDKAITFRYDTPTELLPAIGQVIVSDAFESPIETGFSGRVISKGMSSDGFCFEVEEVGLSDIYDHIVIAGISSSICEDEDMGGALRRIKTNNMDNGFTIPIDLIEVDLGPITITYRPSITLKYIICVGEKNRKNYVDFRVNYSGAGSAEVNCDVKGEYKPEPKWLKPFIPIKTPICGLYGKIQFGRFYRYEGGVKVSASIPFNCKGVMGFSAREESGLKGINSCDGDFDIEDSNITFSLDGNMSFGVAIQLQIGLICEKLASADVTTLAGFKLSGNIDLVSAQGLLEERLYSSIKDSKLTLSFCADIVPGYRFWGADHNELPVSLNLGYDINSWYVVPSFSDLKYEGKGISGKLSGQLSRNILPKVSLGWAIYDEVGDIYKKEYFSQTYRKLEDWNRNGLELLVSDLPSGKSFTAYPIVKLFGIEMRADESVNINSLFPVTIRSFNVTKSQYKQGAFTHKDKLYDYRFDAATTVACATVDGISDWGYVYEDLDGELAHISLKDHGSPYTDTNYAYFRNTPTSYARLYGYVKYEGDEQYYYGESHDYELICEEPSLCPDSNHPHAIDLGIGVKWSCCNVGALAPWECGGYYAWGETEEKSRYSNDNYTYYKSGRCTNIGSNISGTRYDVAHVLWGDGWRMPDKSQMEALNSQCSSEWTEVQGVYGLKYTGTNGASIFIPAAGDKWRGTTYDVNTYGYYWTSTQLSDGLDYAHDLYFNKDNSYVDYASRTYGRSVRPLKE